MNARSLPALVLVALVAAAGGWYAARRGLLLPSQATHGETAGDRKSSDRRVLFYQSAMHPWIKSDRPGKCTICGMELTPVYEGEAGLAAGPGLVTLSSNAITVLSVQTTPVRKGPLVRTLRVAGRIDDDDTRHRILGAYVAGRIEALSVDHLGAEVEAGQPLARFYSPMLLEAERQYLALSGTVPGTAPAELSGEHRLLRDAAVSRLRQLGLTPAQIEALPDKNPTNFFTELLSPISGTVVSRFVYPGQYVMEGEKLFELADFSTMWFQFDAYEQDLPWLAVGQEVEITTPSLPGRTFKAPIRFIDPNLAEATRSAKVRVELPNPPAPRTNGTAGGRLLRHRLYADGHVNVTVPDVLLVPRSAVLSPAGRAVVYVDKNGGAFEQRGIQLGRSGDTDFEVLSGLLPGELVVTTGNLMIDAQAQLNQAVDQAEAGHTHARPATNAPLSRLEPKQADAVAAFLALADGLRATLAGDNLAAFNETAAKLHAAAESLTRAFPADSPWASRIQAVTSRAHLEPAANLRSARQAFHPFSNGLVELGRALRTQDASDRFRELKVFQCPMTAEAFDGAPPRAQWLQLAPPLRNPWFGKEMLECGVEVRD